MQTRIDFLDSLAKNILCGASIVGKRFSLDDIIYLSKEEYSIDEIKSALSKPRKLRFVRRGRNDLYTFHHTLLQRIVYESIPRPKRRELHTTFAENLKEKGELQKENKFPIENITLKGLYSIMGDCYGNLENDKINTILGNILADKGWILFRLGKLKEATDYLISSIEILERIGDKKILATVYNNLGVILWNKGDLSLSLEYQIKNLRISEEIGDPIKIFTCYNNIGLIYESMGDRKRAKNYYEKALNICERIKHSSGIAHSLCNIGTCYLSMGNFGLAERYIKRAIELWENLGVQEWLILALIYLSSARIKGNKLEEAEKTLKRVEEKIKNKGEIPERKLFEKNLIYLEFKRRMKKGLRESQDLLEPLLNILSYYKGINNFENILEISLLLSEIYKEKGEIEKSELYKKNAEEIYKLLNIPEEVNRINEG